MQPDNKSQRRTDSKTFWEGSLTGSLIFSAPHEGGKKADFHAVYMEKYSAPRFVVPQCQLCVTDQFSLGRKCGIFKHIFLAEFQAGIFLLQMTHIHNKNTFAGEALSLLALISTGGNKESWK